MDIVQDSLVFISWETEKLSDILISDVLKSNINIGTGLKKLVSLCSENME